MITLYNEQIQLRFFFSHIDKCTKIELIKYGEQKLNHTCLMCQNKPYWLLQKAKHAYMTHKNNSFLCELTY